MPEDIPTRCRLATLIVTSARSVELKESTALHRRRFIATGTKVAAGLAALAVTPAVSKDATLR